MSDSVYVDMKIKKNKKKQCEYIHVFDYKKIIEAVQLRFLLVDLDIYVYV